MNDITEGIGSAIEGALAGKAVEPSRGEFGDGGLGVSECLNCGERPLGSYCQNCGQKQHVHRTLSAIGHDLIHGVLHLDGKFWRTLPLLVFKPGKLTRRYIEGERAKFVSPMAMFLFSVFAMFAVFQMVGLTAPTDINGSARDGVERLIQNESERISARIIAIDEELAQPNLSRQDREELELERNNLSEDLALLDSNGEGIAKWIASRGTNAIENLETDGAAQIAEAKQRLEAMPEGSAERADLAAEIQSAEEGLAQLRRLEDGPVKIIPLDDDGNARMTIEKSGIPVIDEALKKWRQNPSLMIYKLQANGYKFSWLLIPLSIPFVWLMFAWKRRYKAYDHAIFITYSLSFMSLLLIALSLLGAIQMPGTLIFVLLVTIAPLHLYKHLRHAYGLSRLSALWRFFATLAFIVVVLVLFLQTLLLLGAF
ncbi:DUF3667 domain-containing protein [Erythrobacter ani]|uniref:DUF3667 domain-containing protein n=1 Tax=Erythrobacter ani TaxID=2827235 RepID=A0ABS6SLS5_9SPHN|nr:DUF3667 domain-containing protein [Erythrobacter ani]MBV7265936.1 DUF3667 domain-containing protein [Erythrobacter ani]